MNAFFDRQKQRIYPAIDMALSDACHAAPFALARARICWSESESDSTTGWGRDRDGALARVKAVSEAVERRAWRQLPWARWGRASGLPTAICPDSLTGYADSQFEATDFPFTRFTPQRFYWWLPARAILDDAEAWVAADCVCHPCAFASGYRERLLTFATTSGCASAPRRETAIAAAAFELLERDAFMRHWFAQEGGQPVDLNTLPAAQAARFMAWRRAGCHTGLMCLHLGLHPVWLAWAQHPERHFTCLGTASGADALAALETALNELDTHVLARLDAGPGLPVKTADQARTPADHAALYASAAYFRQADVLWSDAGRGAFSFAPLVATFEVRLSVLYRRLASAGHPLHWVDLSLPAARAIHAGAPLVTVRAVAPGLIPLAFGKLLPLKLDRWRRCPPGAIHPFT